MEEGYLKRVVIALGGNAILRFGQTGTAEEQMANLKTACQVLSRIIGSWYHVVITHGNGPQVGNILIQNEKAREAVPPMPLDVCGAQSQGQTGYLLQQVLLNELRHMGMGGEVSVILTMMLVDRADEAFKNPSKPVGPWLTEKEMVAAKKAGETWVEQPKKGWRRVVPSPRPVRVVNPRGIQTLLKNGQVVIACGGGGVPVIERADGSLQGVEAVIDKDLASERLATSIGAHILLILTDVPGVFLNFGPAEGKPIGRIELRAMKQLFQKGIFPAGSIGPKVEAALQFVENGGEKGIISSLENAEDALKGKKGTMIVRE